MRVGTLGSGGFGRVIEVVDQKTRVRYAMKLQNKRTGPDAYEGIGKAAVHEARALTRLKHPFIVRLYNAFQTDNYMVLLMEFCSQDMNKRILMQEEDHSSRGGCAGIPVWIACRYAGQVALGLQYLHAHGFVYGDIKPENILINGKNVIKLADFGLTQRGDDKAKCRGGTKGFVPHEMYEDETSVSNEAADLFAVGITFGMMFLGERVCRKRVFHGRALLLPPTVQALSRALRYAVDVDLPRSIKDMIDGLTSFDPAARGSSTDLVEHPFFSETLEPNWTSDFLRNPYESLSDQSTSRDIDCTSSLGSSSS